jgi:hypothetical protein
MRLFGDPLEAARRATADDLADVAALIEQLEGPVDALGEERWSQRFVAATELYAEAEQKLAAAADEPAVAAAVSTTAAAMRGLLTIADVLADEPFPDDDAAPCLLDPSHGPSKRFVVWAPPGGDPRPVPACAADAAALDAGAQPQVRAVPVGHRLRPYWEVRELASWFLAYFDDYAGCDTVQLLAGTPLGEELAERARGLDDGVVTAEEIFRPRGRD